MNQFTASAIQGSAVCGILARSARLVPFPMFIMEDKHDTIGLTELLDGVNRDLDELRRKHPNDYSFRNITMWWELEKERLMTRHSPASVVRRPRSFHGLKWATAWLLAGWAVMLAIQTTIAMWVR